MRAALAPMLGSLALTVALGLVALLVAALTTGSSGVAGTGIGLATVCSFFGLGTVVLALVAAISPAASLLVALLTYTLQVVLVGLLFVALRRSGALGSGIDAGWLSGTLIVGTLVWVATQVLAHTRSRQPVYDLPSDGPQAGSA